MVMATPTNTTSRARGPTEARSVWTLGRTTRLVRCQHQTGRGSWAMVLSLILSTRHRLGSMARYDLALQPNVVDLGRLSGDVVLDSSNPRTHFHGTVDGDISDIRVEGAVEGQYHEFTLELTQGSGGSLTTTWRWEGGSEPSLSVGAGQTDIVAGFTRDGGATVFGFLSGRNMT